MNSVLTDSVIPAASHGFRSGFIALIGRPNVGKSTLMNQLIGQKVAITSPVAQTTRNRLRGILSNDQSQVIFVDTPGIHKPHHQLGKILVKNARASIEGVDAVLFVVDGSVPMGKGDRFIADMLAAAKVPIIVGLNKIDQRSPQKQAEIESTYAQLIQQQPQWRLSQFSALTQKGLKALQKSLRQVLPAGPYYYPPDLVTDQPERFIMGELIREQVLLLTREEVPHSVAVVVEKVEESPKVTRVLATIHVERKSQKGILIGKQGSMLKSIGTAARHQMQKLIDGKVYLELFVKVQPKWRSSRLKLSELGYQVETN
ncbi:MAG: GTPase Era [Cyanobacteria bacterium P01_F01_bin.42]